MKIRRLSPSHGDQVVELAPREATEFIMNEKKEGRASFVKFSDGDVYFLMKKTGILQQLQERELRQKIESKDSDVMATIIPIIAGG